MERTSERGRRSEMERTSERGRRSEIGRTSERGRSEMERTSERGRRREKTYHVLEGGRRGQGEVDINSRTVTNKSSTILF